MTHRTALVLLALVLACGCQVSIPLEPDEAPPPAALSGAFSPDSLWSIRLIGSAPYGSQAPIRFLPPIEDASVEIIDLTAGTRIPLRYTSFGIYTAESTPESGHSYAVEAALSGGPTLRARGEAPAAPEFSVGPVEAVGRTSTIGIDVGVFRTTLTLEPAHADESLVVELLRTDGAPDASILPVFFSTSDPSLRDSFADDGPVRVYTEFAGRAVFLQPFASTRTLDLLIRAPLVGDSPSVRVRVTSLSATLRRHLATLDLQDDRGGSPFVEPVRVFSNVEAGAGVFAGYVARDQIVLLPSPAF